MEFAPPNLTADEAVQDPIANALQPFLGFRESGLCQKLLCSEVASRGHEGGKLLGQTKDGGRAAREPFDEIL